MKKNLLWFCLMLLLFGCSSDKSADAGKETSPEGKAEGERQELFVAAAASLTDAMEEITEIYEEEHSDVELTFNFAGSGKLAQQIQQGAPVDVFISANENWMDTLIEEDYIDADERLEVTGNRLVIITQHDTDISYDTFDDIDGTVLDQIAIGNPESVPAGEYTEEILDNLDKWDELEDQFVYAKDVRQVLTYVESGNADIGFVYESDALSSDKVKIITYSNPENHNKIIYPGAILNDSEMQSEGKEFLKYLQSDEGQEILERYGFTLEQNED